MDHKTRLPEGLKNVDGIHKVVLISDQVNEQEAQEIVELLGVAGISAYRDRTTNPEIYWDSLPIAWYRDQDGQVEQIIGTEAIKAYAESRTYVEPS
jgi:hypothetical protein